VAFADARCFVQFDTSGQGSSVDAEPVAIVGGDGPYLPLLSINPDSPFAVRSELFHSNGVSGGYKVRICSGEFATLGSEGFERRISGVRVFERGREDVGLRTSVASLICASCSVAILRRRSSRLTSPGVSGKESYAT
jgi:hypothetical protein